MSYYLITAVIFQSKLKGCIFRVLTIHPEWLFFFVIDVAVIYTNTAREFYFNRTKKKLKTLQSILLCTWLQVNRRFYTVASQQTCAYWHVWMYACSHSIHTVHMCARTHTHTHIRVWNRGVFKYFLRTL